MLIDRTHKSWFVASSVIGTMGASAYYAASQSMPHGMTGGSVIGLVLGIVGSMLMVFAALLAVRKRLPTWRVGSAQWWLRGHLWLGSLGFLLILFHSGFAWGGLLENCLWISFGLVVVTGFIGLAFQQVIPRLLTTRVPLETMVAQIPFLSQTNVFRADQVVAKQVGPLDLPFESLKPFAEEVLKQQRVLKRDSDFPKELAKVYTNVPLPEADAKKSHAAVDAGSAPKLSPLAQMKPATKPPEPTTETTKAEVAPTTPAVETSPAAKPKSPLEIMREKGMAKAAAESTAIPPVTEPSSPVEPALASKPLSPLEMMKAKLAAKNETTANKSEETPKPLTVVEDKPAAPPVVKKPAPIAKPAAVPPIASASVPPKAKPVVVIPAASLMELRDFHLRVARPFLKSGRATSTGLNEVISAKRLFVQLRADLPHELHEVIDELASLCEERRQFNIQLRLHRWLHVWLVFHVPPSIALLVLFVAHVVVSLRVVPFGK